MRVGRTRVAERSGEADRIAFVDRLVATGVDHRCHVVGGEDQLIGCGAAIVVGDCQRDGVNVVVGIDVGRRQRSRIGCSVAEVPQERVRVGRTCVGERAGEADRVSFVNRLVRTGVNHRRHVVDSEVERNHRHAAVLVVGRDCHSCRRYVVSGGQLPAPRPPTSVILRDDRSERWRDEYIVPVNVIERAGVCHRCAFILGDRRIVDRDQRCIVHAEGCNVDCHQVGRRQDITGPIRKAVGAVEVRVRRVAERAVRIQR